jgi:hypothetical protein
MATLELGFWVMTLLVGPVVCAAIAQARGIEWWVGALLGLMTCVGFIIVLVMRADGAARGIAPPPPGARWEVDPTGRHQHRLWDGAQWTANVSDSGRSGWDPLT